MTNMNNKGFFLIVSLTVIIDLDLFFHLLVERVTKYIHKWDHFSNPDSKWHTAF